MTSSIAQKASPIDVAGDEFVTAPGAAPLLGVNRSRAQALLGRDRSKPARSGVGFVLAPEPDAYLWATGSDHRIPLWSVETIKSYAQQRREASA